MNFSFHCKKKNSCAKKKKSCGEKKGYFLPYHENIFLASENTCVSDCTHLWSKRSTRYGRCWSVAAIAGSEAGSESRRGGVPGCSVRRTPEVPITADGEGAAARAGEATTARAGEAATARAGEAADARAGESAGAGAGEAARAEGPERPKRREGGEGAHAGAVHGAVRRGGSVGRWAGPEGRGGAAVGAAAGARGHAAAGRGVQCISTGGAHETGIQNGRVLRDRP